MPSALVEQQKDDLIEIEDLLQESGTERRCLKRALKDCWNGRSEPTADVKRLLACQQRIANVYGTNQTNFAKLPDDVGHLVYS